MATATMTSTSFSSVSGQKGILRRALDRLVTARERQARRYVNGYLLALDDATLAGYGYDRRELQREGSIVGPF